MRKWYIPFCLLFCLILLSACGTKFASFKFTQKAMKESLTQYEKLFAGAPHLAYDEERMGGYINKEGEWVIPPQYLQVGTFYEGLAAVQDYETELWGYIDVHGNTVIEPRFEVVGDFHDGTAVVKVTPEEMQESERYGIINKKGEYLLQPYYSYVSNFKEGFALTYYNWTQEYWYLNKNGEEVFGPYDYASIFNQGRAIVQKNGEYFIIDQDGCRYDFAIDVIELNKPVYYNVSSRLWDDGVRIDQMYTFSDGVRVLDSSEKMALANEFGNIISPYYDYIFPFKDDYAVALVKQDGRYWYGFIDREYNWVIQPQFYGASNFYSGKAWVETGERAPDWAIIDESGNFLSIEAEHNGVIVEKDHVLRTPIGIPIAAYKTKDYDDYERIGGYIDWNYNEIIPFCYEEVKDFAEDGSYAVVRENGLYGMIDGKGNWLIQPRFSQLTEKK